MFILALTFHLAASQTCKVIKSTQPITRPRHLQQSIERDSDWKPIRFHVDWSGLPLSEKQTYEKYIDAGFVYYSNVLKLHQITSKSIWNDFLYSNDGYCDKLIERFKDKIITDTDMLIFIVSEEDFSDTYVGYSVGCGNDPGTMQPIASLISINKAYINLESNSEDEMIMLIIHELAHSLGFSYSDMLSFRDKNGTLYDNETLFTTSEKRGKNVVYLSTPAVKQRARDTFGCSDLPGIELESQGKQESIFHHWDKRMVGTEFMGPQILINDAVYSDITLALFEDSGWYQPDYSYSTSLNFGHQKGCDFITKKCIINEHSNFEEFCVKTDRMYCDFSRLSYGYCDIQEYTSPLEKEFQYFSDENMGGDLFSDYCPINERIYDCRSFFEPEEDYGELFCLNCRCFESTISKSDPNSNLHASCYKINCFSGMFNVTVGNITKTCKAFGENVTFDGFNGILVCPEYEKVCYDAPCRNNCYGGKCEKGICENGGDDDEFYGVSYPDGSDFECGSNCEVSEVNFSMRVVGIFLLISF